MKSIPIHKLQDRGTAGGFEIKHTSEAKFGPEEDFVSKAHRDDHYIFFLIEKGYGRIMIDFTDVTITAPAIYYILPGQVHHRIDQTYASGWYMAVDTALVPKEFRTVFEGNLILQQPYLLTQQNYEQSRAILETLNTHYINTNSSNFHQSIQQSLLNAFIGMAACGFSNQADPAQNTSRPIQIAYNFKSLLTQNYLKVKQPVTYAQLLNISESYLNEALKKVTGFSVTYWIMHEIMLEAKRLLYYSQLNVKEVAHTLGYEDHTYFSRIFKKTAGVTPLEFRESYRK